MDGTDSSGLPTVVRTEDAPLSSNEYNSIGQLTSSKDAAGLITTYTYWPDGRTKAVQRFQLEGFNSITDSYTQYDSSGRVTSVTDHAGNVQKTFYDADGMMSVSVDAHGKASISSYNAKGNLVRSLAADGTETRSVFDAMGRVIWQSDRFVSSTAATVNQFNGNITWNGQDNASMFVLTHTIYDSQGRVVQTIRYKDAKIAIASPDTVGVFETSAPTGLTSAQILSTTSNTYDDIGRLVETKNADGLRSGTIYFANGQAHYSGTLNSSAPTDWYSRTNPLQYFATSSRSESDQWNLDTIKVDGDVHAGDTYVVNIMSRDGSTSQPWSVTGKTSPQQVAAAIAALINGATSGTTATIQATAIDSKVNLTQKSGTAATDFLITVSVAPDSTNLPTINASGHTHTDWKMDARGKTTLNIYDSLQRVTKTVFHDGSFTETLYGKNDQAVSRSDISLPNDFPATLHGQHIVKIQQRKAGDPIVAQHEVYDFAGRLSDTWLAADSNATDTRSPHWHYTYDENGDMRSQVDPLGHTTIFNHDDFHHRVDRWLPAQPLDSQPEHEKYDSFDRLLYTVDFKGQITLNLYDDNLALPESEQKGLGRLVEVQYFDSVEAMNSGNFATKSVHTSYDSLGRRSTVTEKTAGVVDRTTTYAYDAITGGVTSVATDRGTIHYAYDPGTGRLSSMWTGTDPDEDGSAAGTIISRTDYQYDLQGRLFKVIGRKVAGSSSNLNLVTQYGYDEDGNLSSTLLPNGDETDYTYDGLNRLKELNTENATSGHGVFHQVFVYDSAGHRKQVTETRYDTAGTTSSIDVTKWTYDPNGRLVNENFDQDLASITGNESAGDYVDTYAYDLNGNRKEKTHDAGRDGTVEETVDSSYDADDRLQTENSSIDAHDTTFTYDANGSTTGKTTGTGTSTTTVHYLWDITNHMTGYDADGDGVVSHAGDVTYTYDADGNRIGKYVRGTNSTNGESIKYLVDTNNPTGYSQVLEETSTVASHNRGYVLGSDVIVQSSSTGTISYLMYDGHGSTRALLNTTGNVITAQTFDYDAFGQRLDTNGATTDRLYSGEWWDATIGQQFLRARWYDPSEGRFTSYDSFEADPASPTWVHKYLAFNGDPIGKLDPNGYSASLDAAEIGRAVHKAIGDDFKGKLFPFGLSGPSIVSILGSGGALGKIPLARKFETLLPDLVDVNPSDKEVFEVKPGKTKQIIQGYFQLAGYITAFNELDPAGGWQFGVASTYTPPPVIILPSVGAIVIVTPPILGLITYSTLTDYVKNKAQVTAGEEQAETVDTDALSMLDSLLFL